MYVRILISQNAARLRELSAAIQEAYRQRPHGPEHTAACARFHANYDSLAFPGGLNRTLKRLKQFEPDAVEEAIQFLEADPWYFRSGFVKEEIIARLKHARVDSKQRQRLMQIVLRSISTGTRRLARHLAKLAPIVNSASFCGRVEALADSSGEPQYRARHILHVLRSQRANYPASK